jgi:hypothetical protein
MVIIIDTKSVCLIGLSGLKSKQDNNISTNSKRINWCHVLHLYWSMFWNGYTTFSPLKTCFIECVQKFLFNYEKLVLRIIISVTLMKWNTVQYKKVHGQSVWQQITLGTWRVWLDVFKLLITFFLNKIADDIWMQNNWSVFSSRKPPHISIN